MTRERTPQGYGSLKFNEDYSARREKAYKSERNMEYNEYLDKVSTVSYHLMYKKGGGLFVSLHVLRLSKVGNGHSSEIINLHCGHFSNDISGHLNDTISIDPKNYVEN